MPTAPPPAPVDLLALIEEAKALAEGNQPLLALLDKIAMALAPEEIPAPLSGEEELASTEINL